MDNISITAAYCKTGILSTQSILTCKKLDQSSEILLNTKTISVTFDLFYQYFGIIPGILGFYYYIIKPMS